MDIRLDGKVALITGAGSGIGQGIAKSLAEAGADVVINYHRVREGAERTASMVEAAGRKALMVQGDVGNRSDVTRMFDATIEAFGRIDILVNNAGFLKGMPALEMTYDHWETALSTNLTGPFLCSQRAAKEMLRQGNGGRIINITSVHEEAPNLVSVAYTATKGGLRNLTRGFALELAPHGINVIALAPGMINTRQPAERDERTPEYRAREELIPARRAGMPEDIGETVVFLASDAASYLTGSTVFVDGGWMLTWPDV